MNKVRKFWETCRQNYAHLRPNFNWDNLNKRKKYFEETFLNHIDFEDKIVIDYGCGAGQLGLHLFENYNIEKYIGVDIAERSLEFTRKNLEGYNQETYKTPIDFNSLKADIFISLACFQHFPNGKYLRLVLKDLNKSNIKTLVLHIRHGNNKFNDAYNTSVNKGLACRTNETYISSQLSSYKLIRKSEVSKSLSQVLIYDSSS